MTTPSTRFGPCAWDPILCCVFPTGAASVTGNAISAATEVLWQATGQRYGLCSYTIRPCKRMCADSFPFMGRWFEWTGGGWPYPYLHDGMWFNLGCGACPGSCSCTVLQEALLPGPVYQILEVKVDGVALPTTAYRVDDHRILVRTDGGRWPECQDLSKADTQPGTWSAQFTWGEQVPVIGRQALGELACEIVRACQGEDCRVPKNIASLVRQGVTITYPDGENWLERFPLIQMFLDYANPHRLDGAPQVYDPDAQQFRRVGT